MRGQIMRLFMVLGAVVLASLAVDAPPQAIQAQEGGGRVFAVRQSTTAKVAIVWELTSGAAVEHARVRTDGNTGGLAVSPDGRLFVVTDAESGSLWDVTDGGDLTGAQPRAKGIYARTIGLSDTVNGLTFDADGNAYVLYRKSVSEQPVVRVTPDGGVSELPIALEDPRSLLVSGGVLYVVDYDLGDVIAHDLVGGEGRVFATGFARSRAQGVREVEMPSLAAGVDGRLLTLWATVQPGPIATFCCNRPALYDVTDGGDFSDARGGLVLAPRGAGSLGPDGPLAVDGAGSVYAASRAAEGVVYVSRLIDGAYQAFEALAEVPGGRGARITGLAVMR